MRDGMLGRAWSAVTYRFVSALIHQPRLLRLAARVMRQWPWLGALLPVVSRRDAVVAALARPSAFSNTSHAPNLAAGEFVIGMDVGPRQACERRFLEQVLPSAASFAAASAAESRRRIEALKAGPVRHFDLIQDYMVPVAWCALRQAFAQAAPAVNASAPLFDDLRYVGAHLIIGSVATEAVQERARRSGASLNACVNQRLQQLQQAWNCTDAARVARNAVGLMWVAHPASVQACALLMQELLARPKEHRGLAEEVQRCSDPWGNPGVRELLRNHVLELLRFRPPFPILIRDVPRDTWFASDGPSPALASAGSRMVVMTIGALFDPAAFKEPERYCPDRTVADPGDRYLMFGHGGRHCIAQDHVVEVLISALTGLLTLGGLTWGGAWFRRMRYDGPIIKTMRLAFGKP